MLFPNLMLHNIYKGNYKLLAIAPLIILALSLYFIPSIKMGVDFQGGTLITLSLKNNIDAQQLQSQLQAEGIEATVQVFPTTMGYHAEIEVPQSKDLVKAEDLKAKFNALIPKVSQLEVASYQSSNYSQDYIAKKAELDAIADQMFALAGKNRAALNISGTNDLQKRFTESYSDTYLNYQQSVTGPLARLVKFDSISVQIVSPALSASFINSVITISFWAAAFSAIFVFLFFRTVVPSIAVLTGALCDVIIAMGAMGLFGIPLTLASFAALLMLVGFSLDTDILLTTRLVKRKGVPHDNAYDAMKTGLTMSVAAVVAFGALFILSLLTHIPTYYEISAVALAGLFGDMFATWGINAVVVLYYVEHRKVGP
jgi:preprotein translocase subunit SecF